MKLLFELAEILRDVLVLGSIGFTFGVIPLFAYWFDDTDWKFLTRKKTIVTIVVIGIVWKLITIYEPPYQYD